MKKALTKNLGLKILALVFSAFLWLLVMNTENPIMKRTYSGVQVEIVHGEIITNKGNTYQVSEDSKVVNVVVQAKRQVLDKIRAEDIKAVADMKNLTSNSLIEIDVSVPKYSIVDAVAKPGNIQVSIEASSTKTFAITPTTSGTLRDGYVLDEVKADPEKIEISGPKTQVNSIKKAVAEVDISGLSEESRLKAELVLYDANDKIIDPTQLTTNLGNDGVSVKVTLKKTKNVKLEFDTSMIETAEGYRFSEIAVEPQTIRITGTEEELASTDKIEIPAKVLAESGLTEKIVKDIEITEIEKYLPEWATLDEDNPANISVKIGVELLGTKTFEVPLSSIYLKNMAEGFKASYNITGILEIGVRGPQETLDELQLDQSNVSLNMLTYTAEGDYNVPVEVKLPENCSLMKKDLTVQITLEKQ